MHPLSSAPKAKAVEADSAPEGVKSYDLHEKIAPAMTAYPFGAT
jgi:hypothetical protein